MKAIQISAYGGTEQLKFSDVDKPAAKSGQVLVRVHDAGVNPYDWKVRAGLMKEVMPVHFPFTMGNDFAGEVEDNGGVTGFSKGDRVFGFAQGAYAEFVNAHQDKLAKIPEKMDYATAASLPTPGLTGYQLVKELKLQSGQRLLIHGAAGAVGSFAVQLAVSQGVKVFANAASEDEQYLKDMGVQKVIDYQTQRFEEFFHDMDAVIDLVGGDTLKRSYQCVKKNGTLFTTVGPFDQATAQKFSVQGRMFLMQQNGKDLQEVANLVLKGVMRPRVSDVMPLEKAAEAQRLNEKGLAHGKIILHVQ